MDPSPEHECKCLYFLHYTAAEEAYSSLANTYLTSQIPRNLRPYMSHITYNKFLNKYLTHWCLSAYRLYLTNELISKVTICDQEDAALQRTARWCWAVRPASPPSESILTPEIIKEWSLARSLVWEDDAGVPAAPLYNLTNVPMMRHASVFVGIWLGFHNNELWCETQEPLTLAYMVWNLQ